MIYNFSTKIAEMNLQFFNKSILAFAVFFNILLSGLYAQESCVTFDSVGVTSATFSDGSNVSVTHSSMDSYSSFTSCGTTAGNLWSGSDYTASTVFNFNSNFSGNIRVKASGQNTNESFKLYDNTNNSFINPQLVSGCLAISGNSVIGTTDTSPASGGVVDFFINNATSLTISFGGTGGGGIVFDYRVCKDLCPSTPVIPTLSTTTISTVCPGNTANLTSITASNTPANATLTWHTSTPASNANKISNPTAVMAGTYSAAFFYSNAGCYSDANGTGTRTVTVTNTICCNAGTVAPMFNQ